MPGPLESSIRLRSMFRTVCAPPRSEASLLGRYRLSLTPPNRSFSGLGFMLASSSQSVGFLAVGFHFPPPPIFLRAPIPLPVSLSSDVRKGIPGPVLNTQSSAVVPVPLGIVDRFTLLCLHHAICAIVSAVYRQAYYFLYLCPYMT
jgi:hypothetical protein